MSSQISVYQIARALAGSADTPKALNESDTLERGQAPLPDLF